MSEILTELIAEVDLPYADNAAAFNRKLFFPHSNKNPRRFFMAEPLFFLAENFKHPSASSFILNKYE